MYLQIALFALWLAGGFLLLDASVRSLFEYPARIGFLSVSFAGLSYLARHFGWVSSRYTTLALLPLLTVVLLWEYAPPFRSYAWLAWLAALLAHFYILRPFTDGDRIAQAWHGLGIALAVLVLVLQLHWFIGVTTWQNTAISLVLSVFVVGALYAHLSGVRERALYIGAAVVLAVANLVFLVVVSLTTDGNPMPLAYRPLLNPYDVAILVALGVAALATGSAPLRFPLRLGLAGLAVALVSLSAIRAVDHLAG